VVSRYTAHSDGKMQLKELSFNYPEELLAKEPVRPSRVMWVQEEPEEISTAELIERIPIGDVLVINDTKVLKRRVFVKDLEILFIRSDDRQTWEVLFPASRYDIGDVLTLPEGIKLKILSKGRPQTVLSSEPLEERYFERIAELPLPPYIQKARKERHTKIQDNDWYQTAWAEKPGSLAAPTASLHFSQEDMAALQKRGVKVVNVTLHVSLGTFLPVMTENIDEHKMHAEYVSVPTETWATVLAAKKDGKKIWAMGTTAARALESVTAGKLIDFPGGFHGLTDLFIMPSFKWQVVDRLMTNFHQPESTLVALVAAFSDLEKVKSCYQWAIDRKFRLFSYGDLTVWLKT
jgi:S-adenosylmethionine:tRNA ribosyltransferase-isomerase